MTRNLHPMLRVVWDAAGVLLLAAYLAGVAVAQERRAPPTEQAPKEDPQAAPVQPAPPLSGGPSALDDEAPREDPLPRPVPSQAAQWIEQLADSAFVVREAATRKLAEAGTAVRPLLLAALEHADPEVRLRARRCLARIAQEDFANRLAAFQARTPEAEKFDLPLWRRYRREIGEDDKARELYVEMLKAEGGLLETAEYGGKDLTVETVAVRCRQWQQLQSLADPQLRRTPPLGTVAAMLLVTSDAELPVNDQTANWIINFINQAAFQEAIQSAGPAKRLLGNWLRQPSTMSMAYQKVNLAIRLNAAECVIPAGQLIADKNTQPYMRMYGLLALAKFGKGEHIAWLTPHLGDAALCSQRVTVANGQRVTFRGEVRDFALLALVRITGQSPKDYGFSATENNYSVYTTSTVGFATEEERQAALNKWLAWAASHPTPEPAPQPPPLVAAAPLPAALAGRRPTAAVDELGFYASDREWRVRLSRGEQLLEQGREAEAAQLLDLVLAEGIGSFQPEREHPIHRGVVGEAYRLFQRLSEEGARALELQLGTAARRKLESAVAEGDAEALVTLARRYAFLSAGQEAALLWSQQLLDSGQPLLAALVLKRLKTAPGGERLEPDLSRLLCMSCARAGLWDDARAAAANLDSSDKAAEKLAAALRESAQVIDGGGWRLYRGDERRLAAGDAGTPWLRAQWQMPTAATPAAMQAIAKARQSLARVHQVALPGAQPLAVDGKLLVRTTGELAALDIRTGAPLWRVPFGDSLDELLHENPANGDSWQWENGLHERLWDDLTYGTMSCDGQRVYGVEDVGFAYGLLNQRATIRPDGARRFDPGWPNSFNRLTAYDVQNGKLLWELGGPEGARALPLAGTFFLGPPLPLGKMLLVIAERGAYVVLLTLQARDGQLVSELPLATIDATSERFLASLSNSWQNRPGRRLCGATPSFADGVLVCPTSRDSYVAVDVSNSELLWSYRPMDAEFNSRPRAAAIFGAAQPPLPDGYQRDARWTDCVATLAGGKAILTPAESDRLYCLDLFSGQRQWTRLREDGLYIGGVHDGVLLVVGRNYVRGLRLADGQPAWAPLPLPDGSVPSGRGLHSAGRYYLPLSTAEVAVIDMARGRIVKRSRSFTGQSPGNLIAYGRRIVSQNAEQIAVFPQLDDALAEGLKRLEAEPQNAARQAELGELLLFSGEHERALKLLSQAYRARRDATTGKVLAAAALQALEHDFAAHQKLVAELEEEFTDDAWRLAYHRAVARGLEQSGQPVEAVRALLKAADAAAGERELQPAGSALYSTSQRWLQGRLADVYAAASPADQAAITGLLEARLRGALQSADAGQLRRFAEQFALHPVADKALEALVSRPDADQPWLARELHWLRLLEASTLDAAARRAALARLAIEQSRQGRHQASAGLYRILRERHADAPCLDGKTGRELFESLAADSPVRAVMNGEQGWPRGDLHVSLRPAQAAGRVNYIPIAESECSGPDLLDALQLVASQNHQVHHLCLRDGLGNVRITADLGDRTSRFAGYPLRCARRGHLAVVQRGNELFALDLSAKGNVLLWSRTLDTGLPGMTAQAAAGLAVAMQVLPNGRVRVLNMVGEMPALGPVGSRQVYYQHGRNVTAVDPISGRELWERRDITPGSTLLGDDEALLVAPPQARQALVLRGADGKELGYCELPDIDEALARRGRLLLVREEAAEGAVLRMRDPWLARDVWRLPLSSTARTAAIGDDALGVLDAEGALTILVLATGEKLLQTRLQADPKLTEVQIVRTQTRYLVFANRTPAGRVNVVAVGGAGQQLPVNGRVYGLDRASGKLVWEAEVENAALDRAHPPDLPVLVMAARALEQDPQGRVIRQFTRLVCLDVRDGRKVYEDQQSSVLGNLNVTADAKHRTVIVDMQRYALHLRFEEAPLEAP